ncbi:MAG: c-type cytochrome [Thiobacillaceae bacterium]
MIPSPRSHLYRLAAVLVVGIGGLLFIKGLFVPDGWDYQHWYRSGAVEELKRQPITYGGNASCGGCHGKTRKDHVAIMNALAGSVHEHLSCESCHGPLNENNHIATVKIVRDSSLCLRCHDDVAGRPRKVGLFSDHFLAHESKGVTRDSNCTQCHDPHAPRPRLLTTNQGRTLPESLRTIVPGCNGCHKPGTRMPLIAGQPPDYLRNVMREFRRGSRHSEAMKGLFADYDDTLIDAIAQYYASLSWVDAVEQVDATLVKAGSAIHERRCAACHGSDGRNAEGLTPRLAGQPIRYIEAKLTSYLDPRSSQPNEVMRMLVKGLSAEDVQALANFYASNPSAPRAWITELMSLAAGCESCHRSGLAGMPLIDGQAEEYLRVVMLQYRDGTRSSVVMADLLRDFSNEKITALAKLYATTRWPAAKPKTNPALVRAGREVHNAKCAGCHGPGGVKAEGMTPRLAGQNPSYIEAQLRNYMNSKAKLPGEMMRTVTRDLSAGDVHALAQYYASGQDVKPASEAAASATRRVDVSNIVTGCDNCHTPSDATDTPLIDGQPEAYLRTVMQQFRDGSRDGKIMGKAMKKYDADQIASLAYHYAQKKWISAASDTRLDLVKRGKTLHDAHCNSCHANGGKKSASDMPRLAGQPVEFIELEIKRYQNPASKLPNQFMRTAVNSLSAEDISALANYYASQGK